MTVEITVQQAADHLLVEWSDRRGAGSCRFDRLPGTRPEFLGAADELLEGADRRTERRVLDALAGWAEEADLEVGIWHDGGGVEILA